MVLETVSTSVLKRSPSVRKKLLALQHDALGEVALHGRLDDLAHLTLGGHFAGAVLPLHHGAQPLALFVQDRIGHQRERHATDLDLGLVLTL